MIDPKTFLDEKYTPNELQQDVLELDSEIGNLVVAAPTGSGKSNVFSMRAHKVLFTKNPLKRKKVVYIAPMKAIVEQKKEQFLSKDSPYNKFTIGVMTGDYYSEKDDKTGRDSDIIIATPESFASKLRNIMSDSNDWIADVALLFIDEVHYIGDSSRGSAIEDLIMSFTYWNPSAEVNFVSGTIPNSDDFSNWLNDLNKLDTYLIQSDYRPVPVDWHFIPIKVGARNNYGDEERKTRATIEIIQKEAGRSFMVGVFKKDFGRKVTAEIERQLNKNVKFHSADSTPQERKVIESAFIGGTLDGVVCTQTLAVGVNTPASIVIVPSVTLGNGSPVETLILQQLAGRAGRQGFDTRGDVYFLVPEKDLDFHKKRILEGEKIKSCLSDKQKLALGFLGAVNNGIVNDRKSFITWYKRTLHFHQNDISDEVITTYLEAILETMLKFGMVNVTDENKIVLKRRGIICVQMAFDPYAAYQYITNFNRFFALSTTRLIDIALAYGENVLFADPLSASMANFIPETVAKHSKNKFYHKATTCVLKNLQGDKVPPAIISTNFMVLGDIDRVVATLCRFANESERGNWESNAEEMFQTHRHMIKHGVDVSTAKLMAQGASKYEATQLKKKGASDLRISRGLGSRRRK